MRNNEGEREEIKEKGKKKRSIGKRQSQRSKGSEGNKDV
jgi:hypothetical protein